MGAHRGFGELVELPFEIPGWGRIDGEPDVVVEVVTSVEDVWSGHGGGADWPLALDGRVARFARGRDGDMMLRCGGVASFHIAAGGSRVLVAPGDVGALEWRRVLLDTVLWSVALQRGARAIHAGAVLVAGSALAISGPSGAGKTTLLLDLLQRGHQFVSDDVLVFRTAPAPLAAPGPPLLNVPARARGHARGHELGRLGDEHWMVAVDAAADWVPLAGILLLDRGDTGGPRVEPVLSSLRDLHPASMGHGLLPNCERLRFETAADAADAVPVARLLSGGDAAPRRLGDVAEAWAREIAADLVPPW